MAMDPEALKLRKEFFSLPPDREDVVRATARKVKKARIHMGATVEELAWFAGITKKTLENIEAGKSCPMGLTIAKLASALYCEPQDLMPSLKDIT